MIDSLEAWLNEHKLGVLGEYDGLERNMIVERRKLDPSNAGCYMVPGNLQRRR